MDTILVAVGVPTKEVPGASISLPFSVAERDVEKENGNATRNPAEGAEPHAQGGGEGAEGEGAGNGWDIPDISDLLDSVYETEEENSSTFQGGVTDGDTGIDARPGRTEESDLDEEHFSWSWKDTDWTSGTSQE